MGATVELCCVLGVSSICTSQFTCLPMDRGGQAILHLDVDTCWVWAHARPPPGPAVQEAGTGAFMAAEAGASRPGSARAWVWAVQCVLF